MSRIYATDESTGERVLLRIECDKCEAAIKPGAFIVDSGWTKRGSYYGPGDERNCEAILCPSCSTEAAR